ncbi:uncharacterized protein [Periplaneta americana]
MDVIKTEPDVDPLTMQTSDNTDVEVKTPLSEDGNSVDRPLTGMKTECMDDSSDVASEMNFEENPVPNSSADVKIEVQATAEMDGVAEPRRSKRRRVDKSSSSDSSSEDMPAAVPRDKTLTDVIRYSFLILLFQNIGKGLLFLREKGLLAKEYYCPRCDRPMTEQAVTTKRCKDLVMWYCCKDKVWRSIRSGSWFSRSKLSLQSIMCLTFMWVWRQRMDYVRAEVDVSATTIVDWFSFCREVCGKFVDRKRKIGGPGKVVQVDVSSFGSVKYDKGKPVKNWVFGGIVQGSEGRDCFFHVVTKNDKVTFLNEIKNTISEGSIVHCDKWDDYGGLSDSDIAQFSLNHNVEFNDNETNNMQYLWSAVKHNFGKGKRLGSMLQSHLNEYVWRRSIGVGVCRVSAFLKDVSDLYEPRNRDE